MFLTFCSAALIVAAQWVYIQHEPPEALSPGQFGWVALQLLERGYGLSMRPHPAHIVFERQGDTLWLSASSQPRHALDMTPRPTLLLEIDHRVASLVEAVTQPGPPDDAPVVRIYLEPRAFAASADALAERLMTTLLERGFAITGARVEGGVTLCVLADGTGVKVLDEPPEETCDAGDRFVRAAPAEGAEGDINEAWHVEVVEALAERLHKADEPAEAGSEPLSVVPVMSEDVGPRHVIWAGPSASWRGDVDGALTLYTGWSVARAIEVFGKVSAGRSRAGELRVAELSSYLGAAFVWSPTPQARAGLGLGLGGWLQAYSYDPRQGRYLAWALTCPLFWRWTPGGGRLVIAPGVDVGWTQMRVTHRVGDATIWQRRPWHVRASLGAGWTW